MADVSHSGSRRCRYRHNRDYEGVTLQPKVGVDVFVEQFYAAYNEAVNGDPEPMLELGSQEPYVSAMHSVGGENIGWEQVAAAWRQLASVVSSGTMSFESLIAHTIGDMAYVAGIEQGSLVINDEEIPFQVRVTNIFEHQNGTWKAVHHHGDADPAFAAVLG